MDILRCKKHIIRVVKDRIIFYVSPTNLHREKSIFLSKDAMRSGYEPQFNYRKILFDQQEVQKEINRLRSYNGKYQECFHAFADRAQIVLECIKARGTKQFHALSRQLYGIPKERDLRYARAILREPLPAKDVRTFSPEYIKEMFQDEVASYGWRIVIQKNLSSKMKCVSSRRQLVIAADATFTKREMRRLRYHEIRTHIQRSVNNDTLPKEVQGCFDYLETEEGLAIKMEERNNCLSRRQLRIYAGRTLAVNYAQKEPFSKVFSRLIRNGFDEHTAFHITARSKRGVADTSLPGGFTRDHIYLSGKMKLDRFKGDIDDLFIGKIGLDDIQYVKRIISKEKKDPLNNR